MSPQDKPQGFSRFQEPSTLYAKVTPESLKIPNDIFFKSSNSKYQKYREAWAASLFARGFSSLVNPCEVRLVPEDERFPDFEIRVEHRIYPFEFTEAQVPSRRRGDEYKQRKIDPLYGPPAIFADMQEVATWICDKVKMKANKFYNPKPHLLVYANFQVAEGFNLDPIREACQIYRSTLQSIWLLWAVSIVQVFPSDDFGRVCEVWNEIPGYREECERVMGITR